MLTHYLLDALVSEEAEAAPLMGGAEDAPVEEGCDITVRHLECSGQVAHAIQLRYLRCFSRSLLVHVPPPLWLVPGSRERHVKPNISRYIRVPDMPLQHGSIVE